MKKKSPTVLCIMDGWGINSNKNGNAIALAKTPFFDKLISNYPNTKLITHGLDVGLPKDQMGNSEVGHTNIGAGRVVYMDLPKIDKSISSGHYKKNPVLLEFIQKLKESNGTAHILGLASDGGVHSSMNHLLETIHIISEYRIPIFIHVLTDGRDVAPRSAEKFIKKLIKNLPKNAEIATLMGRYFAMDRDNRWGRTERAYKAIISGQGRKSENALNAIKESYKKNESDEFITPTIISSYTGASDGDGLVCINFRSDRVRQIMSALGDPSFEEFNISKRSKWEKIISMTKYSDEHNNFVSHLFSNEPIKNTLGAWVSKHGCTQLRLAETEKYPHVTFFLNGGVENTQQGETRIMPASPKVSTYNLAPEMSSEKVTQNLIQAIKNKVDLIIVNYANPDMVGHTGDLNATIKACEAIDRALIQIVTALRNVNGCMLLTSDHGNCEKMIDYETNTPHTAHTTNLVPAILVGRQNNLRPGGRLADIAPTILELMQLPQPAEMTGESLLC